MAKGNTWFLNIREKGSKKASKNVNKLKGDMNGLGSSVKKLAGVMGALYLGKSLIGAAKGAIDTAAKFEQLQLRLENMYGSAEKGEEVFNKFAKIASTTPFELANVVEAGAALKAFGSNAEETLKPVADLAAFMGVDVVEAANAVGRAFAGGAGAADVLRDRGILQLIKDSQGIVDLTAYTLPQFRDAMFKTLTDPSVGIAGATNKLAKTWGGMVSNLKDSLEMMKAAIGKIFIEKLKPMVADMNEELAKMGDIGWDYIAEAFTNNWKEIFKQLAGVFFEAGKFLGQAVMEGFGIGVDNFAIKSGELWQAIGLFPEFYAKQNKKFESKIDRDNQQMVINFQNRIDDIKVEWSGLMSYIKTEAEDLKQADILDEATFDKLFALNEYAPEMDPNMIWDLDPITTQGTKYISILEAQTQKVSNSLNKRVEEFIKYGVSEADANTWKEEQLLLHQQKMNEAKESQRIKELEDNIVASDAAEYELEKFTIGLESRYNALKKAGVDEVELEKWKAEQIAKYQKQDLQSRLRVSGQLIGAMASFNDAAKGSAKVTARMQQVQAIINTWSAANAAISPPPTGYGPTPLGYAALSAAVITGLANVRNISESIGDFALGGDFVTSGEQLIRVGDNPGGRERVQVTPLSSPNINGPQGSNINVNISGNVMSENYTEEVIIPQIEQALRRGENI